MNMIKQRAQVVLEFLFCMVVLLLIIYGCIMAIRWGGVSMVQVGIDHNQTLTVEQYRGEKWIDRYDSTPYHQLEPAFYSELPMGLVFNKW
jgi:hypothetical protein